METLSMGHSAQVEMCLLLNDGRAMRIAQMGPDFLILESATEHPPGNATLELRVDESERMGEAEDPAIDTCLKILV